MHPTADHESTVAKGADPTGPWLDAANLTLSYPGGVTAIASASLAIARGEFVSIVGPSGCGKSTFLRIAAGLIEPTAGTFCVGAQSARDARARGTIRQSFVFQDANLLPWRTVAENVRLPLELAGCLRAGRTDTVGQELAKVGLSGFARRYPAELSGGMRMRVSLARALAMEPEMLLLDEPFAALDDITRQTLNEELRNAWLARRWTALFVTHNIAEAAYLSTRIVVMTDRPGRIAHDVRVPFGDVRPPELRAEPEFARFTGDLSKRLRGVQR